MTVAVCSWLLSNPQVMAVGLGVALKIVAVVIVFVALVTIGEIIYEFLEKVVLEIATANLITTYSANLLLAKTFLNSAADKLDDAERKTLSYMGG